MTRRDLTSKHAYDAAMKRLRDKYTQEFARFYDEERVSRGLQPLLPRKKQRITELEAELARLRTAAEQPAPPGRKFDIVDDEDGVRSLRRRAQKEDKS